MMKKITTLKALYFGLLLISGSSVFAKQVPQQDAKTVAENFFSKHSSSGANSELSYTSFDSHGNAIYYVFNMNNNSGFVIINAEDAGHPIIGYSTESGFQKPDPRSPLSFWLSKREDEIKKLRENNIPSGPAINVAWESYLTPRTANKTTTTNHIVGPLLSTKWNQSPYYNDSCPGGSVTGCVATTMAQIMRYWSYPAQGTGSSSYCDCFSSGFSNNYGTLHANYSTTYNWNNMPTTITGHNADVAKLMYHCGVSVNMDYDPAGSAAAVINLDSPTSAEHSFVNYFKYDPNTILGVYRQSYSDAVWLSMLVSDIDLGRPVQYVGFGSQGGHTWVCDGYDDNGTDVLFHMNWGWGSAGDGYYSIDALNPTGLDFNQFQECLFGIVPIGTSGNDAGVVSIRNVDNGCINQYVPSVKIRNYSSTPLTSLNIHYTLDNGTTQVVAWTGYLVTGQAEDITLPASAFANGAHNISCFVSNPNNGTDANTANDQSTYSFALYSTGTLPVVEGFEAPSQTANDWAILPSQNGSDWQITAQSHSGGAQSLMINNLTNHAGNVSILQGLKNYDFSIAYRPVFHFKVAYQQKVATNKDKLSLQVSSDCGKTWWTKWTKQGTALASTSALSSSAFVPAVTDFTSYDIPGLISHNTIFRWVFEADPTAPGNNVYLDDINLRDDATVGISENSLITGSGFSLYPNPANSETFLKFKLETSSSLEISVTDISGRKVIDLVKTEYSAGEQLVSLNKENTLSQGVYMITISANGIKSSRKLIIN